MTNSKKPPFGLQRDGSIDRRDFLPYRRAVGCRRVRPVEPGLGFRGRAADPFKLGWIRPTTGRLASSFAHLYFGGLIADRRDQCRRRHHGPPDRARRRG